MTLEQLIDDKLRFLQQQNIASSRYELRLLLAEILKTDVDGIRFYKDELTAEQREEFEKYVLKRAQHCPVDKIIGHKGFYKYEFKVNENVLSPRPETELLVEEGLKFAGECSQPKILELGVGSGCVLLSVLAEMPQAFGFGADISLKALEVAKENAKRLGVENRVRWFNLSWFDENAADLLGGEFDVIISNPPYIPTKEIASLDSEVKNFDPITALDGGEDGLRDYWQIMRLASLLLKQGGRLLFELGEGQAQIVAAQDKDFGLIWEKTLKDLSGTERCIILKK